MARRSRLVLSDRSFFITRPLRDAARRFRRCRRPERKGLRQPAGPYVLLGKVEIKKGDASLAAGFLQRALKMDPNNYYAHYILGEAYKQLGRAADADREFALTQSLRPKDQ